MKRFLLALLILLTSGQALLAQNSDGQIVASQYGQWQVSGFSPNTYSFSPTACRVSGGGKFFFAFAVGAPIKIQDGQPSKSELVTPTAVTANNITCAISIAPVNDHQLPYSLISGTGGLQEAINTNLTTPTMNTIVLTADWYQLVGPSNAPAVIAAAKGSTQLGLVDVTQVPNVFYQWNGTTYAALTPGGGGSCTTCVNTVNGLSGTVGVVAGNGNVTIGQAGQNITISAASGGGGGSSLGTLQNDLVANNAGNTAAIDMLNFLATLGYSPQSAVTQAVTQNGMVTLTPGSVGKVFTNTSANPAYIASNTLGVKVQDDANLGAVPRSGTEHGMQCDTRVTGVAVTSGSTTASIFGDFFYLRDIGKTLTLVGAVSGVPTAFETVISNVASNGSSTATMTTAAPFTLAGSNVATLGHDDTAALVAAQAAAFTRQQSGATQFTALSIPGGSCLTHTLSYAGISIEGLNGSVSALSGFPGEDVIAEPDPALGTAVSGNGVHLHDFTINVDNRIDATLPWKVVGDSGTVSKTAMSRPAGILSVWANNPLAPQWFQGTGRNLGGTIDGAAAVTNGSANITVPAGMNLPVATNKLVFPYASTGVFTTTVSSVNTGTRVVTMAATYPGTTASQAVWFAGASPQTLNASITSGTCPSSITLTNSIIPGPVSESAVAPYGMIRIDNELFSYFGKTNAYTGGLGSNYLTITGCAQGGTTRANHSSGATVVPVNPFQPAVPWPATPTVNSNQTTPTTAALFPAWNIGNSGFAAPNSNGNNGVLGAGSFANATIDHLYINGYPSGVPVNHTAGIYLVGLPYSSGFENITTTGTYFGIEEGQPSLNTGGSWAGTQPTADGTHWFGIRISACDVFDFISGGQNSFKDFNVYSDCYSGTATDNGLQPYYGADAGMAFTYGWSDEGLFVNAQQGNIDLHNMYEEGEFASGGGASHYGLTPGYEFDMNKANWDNLHIGSGQEMYLNGQHKFTAGNFSSSGAFPIINYSVGSSAEGLQGSFTGFSPSISNTYGTGSIITFGKNSSFSVALGDPTQNAAAPPYGSAQLGNSRESWHGQDELPFILGNYGLVNENGGYIPASEFNANGAWESLVMNIPWAYDSTLLPDGSPAAGSVGCKLNGAQISCLPYKFNEGVGIGVGPGQRMAAQKYTLSMAVKSTGAATSFTLQVGVCSFNDSGSFSVPVTSAWSIFTTQVDLTGKGGCGGAIALGFGFPTPANDNVYVAYANFAPVAAQLNVTNLSAANVSTATFNDAALASFTGQYVTIGTNGSLTPSGTSPGGGGGGGISALSLTMPTWFTVTPGTLTANGTFAVTGNTSTLANLVVASPNGSAGAVAPRALVAADIPTLPYLTALTGDVTTAGFGSAPATVSRINGQALGTLATGLLQNNTGSGIPSIATGFTLSGTARAQTVKEGIYNVPCTNTPVFDPSQGNVQILLLTTGCNAITNSSITNLPASGDAEQITFIIQQDSTGGRPFPNPTWASGWTPIQQTASGTTAQRLTATSSGVYGDSYNSAFCALSGAGPLACGTAYKGFFTIPAGTNPTVTVNTSAISSMSIVDMHINNSIGASVVPAVTCNTTIPASTPYIPVAGVNAGVSFTAQVQGTFTGNPICVSYTVVNP